MSLSVLDNLVRIGQLKPEPRNALEVKRMPGWAASRERGALPMLMALPTRQLWRLLAGMAIAAKIDTPFSSAWPALDQGLKKAAKGYGREADV